MKENTRLHIFGPCALESFEQISKVAKLCVESNITYLRAQVFKPRTSPYSFQGLGAEGVEVLKKIRNQYSTHEIKFVTEVCSTEQLDLIAPYTNVIQIGARNMQNFELLKSIKTYFDESKHDFVLLKRGFANTVDEWIAASQYLINSGIPKEKIVLCERGIRNFASPTGVTLDFIGALKAKSYGYRVICDPSHGTKSREFVAPLAMASMAIGVDGVIVECHPTPSESISDAKQAISLEEARALINQLSQADRRGQL
jgi:3-deoxy-7-phosphoheptulonate synthase